MDTAHFHPQSITAEEPSHLRRGVHSGERPNEEGERPSAPMVIPMRSVICHECGRVSEVPSAALSAHCIYCKAHLALGDVTLFPGSPKLRVRTQGDVTIHPRAVLSHLDIHCHTLTMKGIASGTFVCSGALDICSETVITGAVNVHTLRVRENAHVTLRKSATVHHALIEGTLEGKLDVSGVATVSETGVFLGDLKKGDLIIRPGGIHRGHLPKK